MTGLREYLGRRRYSILELCWIITVGRLLFVEHQPLAALYAGIILGLAIVLVKSWPR